MQLAAAFRQAAINAGAVLANTGYLRIFSTDSADPDSSPSGTLLAELRFGSTAFQSATDDGTNASAVANALTQDSSADASGTAAHWRAYKSDGTTMIAKGTVSGTGGGGELQLNNTAIVAGGIVSVSSFTWRAPQGS
jgi:hypothetical protein